ncbi:MAG: RHS repeat-associated core domain-containing protein [Bacteroidales bacterium]|nr:RHS repeat-associated core domain-containing protein [Bacteroidales bacterium]
MVYSQDGNLRDQGKWTYNAYDNLGRLAYTAVVNDNRTREQLQASLMHASPRVTFNEANGTIFGYTASRENITTNSILSVNYYDNYDFISNFANDSLAYRNMTGYDSKYTGLISAQSAKGLLTGTVTRVLGDTTMLVKSLYYDCHGNVIQSHESNAVGGYEHDYYHLTFTGKPLAVRHEHSTGTAHHVDINTMTYDAMERLLTTTVTHDGEQVDVISNTYDDLGRLASQSCLNNQQTTTYSYNIRNWITQIYAGIDAHSFPVMKQSLHYADAVTGSTPCFNGNISAMDWNTLSHYVINRYCYSYDGMNRLTQAGHMVYSPNADFVFDIPECYSTSYSYDLNSNITSLTRHGKSEQYTSLGSVFYNYGLIDNLSITRDGNQLKKVTDYCDELTYAGAMDFKDGANEQVEYTYDANGNMTSDLNKGISEIKYNILNLPEKITHNNGHITYITYAADGRKLRVTYKINPLIAIGDPVIHPGEPVDPIGPLSMLPANELNGNGGSIPIDPQPVSIERVIMTRDYCGVYTYRNGAIERILMGNGFMQDSLYFVQIKDYQGNVRAVLDQNHNVVERNDYYPYGGLINASDTQLQPYKYSSKELDRENGLDLYDSQARWYDPMLPGTTIQDPLAEKYYSISPYTWCAGNPIEFVDLEGEKIRFANGVSEEFKQHFAQAVKYLNKHGMGGLLAKLERRKETIYIAEWKLIEEGSFFDPSDKTIYWNPFGGLVTSLGVVLSPTTVLNHENDHALQELIDPDKKHQDLKTEDKRYKNKEEKRVITGIEQKTAKALGEIEDNQVTREDHEGNGVRTYGPTSNKIDENYKTKTILEDVFVTPQNNNKKDEK